ncbi:MAG: response regulator [Maricaulaceae bacterium]|jgi:CheY-like chemotaxis protein
MKDFSEPSAPAAAETGVAKARATEAEVMTVLTVDDSRIDLMFMEEQVKALGHETVRAANGAEAIEALSNGDAEIDVVLLDREMPFMDGLTTLKHIKDDPRLRDIPIIILTSTDDPASVAEGVAAGAFYYLTKPVDTEVLRSVLAAAAKESAYEKLLRRELSQHRASFEMIEQTKFRFRTLDEAVSVAGFMANWFPQPDKVVRGLAELLFNAVEHGSLDIGYELKSVLLEQGEWRSEIERRLSIEPYASRTVEAVFLRRDGGYCVVITDQGPGFDWKQHLTIDPARAGDKHGRGIVHARTLSFDKVSYNEKGNRVAAFTRGVAELEW